MTQFLTQETNGLCRFGEESSLWIGNALPDCPIAQPPWLADIIRIWIFLASYCSQHDFTMDSRKGTTSAMPGSLTSHPLRPRYRAARSCHLILLVACAFATWRWFSPWQPVQDVGFVDPTLLRREGSRINDTSINQEASCHIGKQLSDGADSAMIVPLSARRPRPMRLRST